MSESQFYSKPILCDFNQALRKKEVYKCSECYPCEDITPGGCKWNNKRSRGNKIIICFGGSND
jgi:hypothetical protein